MKYRNLFAASLVALMLSGCWESATPYITMSRIDDPGFAREYLEGEKSVTITRSGDYWTKRDATSTTPYLRFDLVKDGWYIVQQENSGDSVQYGIIHKRDDGKVLRYSGECVHVVTKVKGVTTDESGDCQFNGYEALVEGAKAYVTYLEQGNTVPAATYVPK